MKPHILESLKNNKLFSKVNISEINLNEKHLNLLSIKEGEIVYRDGESGDSIYLMVKGEVKVIRRKSSGGSKSRSIYDDDFFGESEYLQNTSRTSNAFALKDSYIIRLDRDAMEFLINLEPIVLKNLEEREKEPVPEEILMQPEKENEESKDLIKTVVAEEEIIEDNFIIEEEFSLDENFLTDDKEILKAGEVEEDIVPEEIKENETAVQNILTEKAENPEEEIIPVRETEEKKETKEEGPEEKVSEEPKEPVIKFPPREDRIKLEDLKKLTHAANLINSKLNLDELLFSIVQAAADLTGADRGTIFLVDREKNEL